LVLEVAAAVTALVCLGCGEEPRFVSVLLPTDTYDTAGPYLIEAWVVAPAGSKEFTVHLLATPEATSTRDLVGTLVETRDGSERWQLSLPGRPAGTAFYFFLALVERSGHKVVYPAGAPAKLASFRVLATAE